jgi:glutathione-independent formaldehyde dehydrogenase
MEVTREAGRIGIPGLYVTDDPGAKDEAARRGSLSVRLGLGWAKSHAFFTGQTPVMKYNRALMQAILWDRINIAEVVGVELITLDQAPAGLCGFRWRCTEEIRHRPASAIAQRGLTPDSPSRSICPTGS